MYVASILLIEILNYHLLKKKIKLSFKKLVKFH